MRPVVFVFLCRHSATTHGVGFVVVAVAGAVALWSVVEEGDGVGRLAAGVGDSLCHRAAGARAVDGVTVAVVPGAGSTGEHAGGAGVAVGGAFAAGVREGGVRGRGVSTAVSISIHGVSQGDGSCFLSGAWPHWQRRSQAEVFSRSATTPDHSALPRPRRPSLSRVHGDAGSRN